jgi:hypothetical protein
MEEQIMATVGQVKLLADRMAQCRAACDIPTGELYRSIALKQYEDARQELFEAIDTLAPRHHSPSWNAGYNAGKEEGSRTALIDIERLNSIADQEVKALNDEIEKLKGQNRLIAAEAERRIIDLEYDLDAWKAECMMRREDVPKQVKRLVDLQEDCAKICVDAAERYTKTANSPLCTEAGRATWGAMASGAYNCANEIRKQK